MIRSNSSWPATSGGEIWIKGAIRSSARHISPCSNRRSEVPAEQLLPLGQRHLRAAVALLAQPDREEVAGAAHVADDRQLEQALE